MMLLSHFCRFNFPDIIFVELDEVTKMDAARQLSTAATDNAGDGSNTNGAAAGFLSRLLDYTSRTLLFLFSGGQKTEEMEGHLDTVGQCGTPNTTGGSAENSSSSAVEGGKSDIKAAKKRKLGFFWKWVGGG